MDAPKIALAGAGTSILSKLLSKYLGQLDPQVHVGLTAAVTMAMSSVSSKNFPSFFDLTNTWYLAAAIAAIYICYKLATSIGLYVWLVSWFKGTVQAKPEVQSQTLHAVTTLTALTSYVKQNPTYFPSVKNFHQGIHLAQPLYGVYDSSQAIRAYCSALEGLSYPSLDDKHTIHDPSLQGSMMWRLEYKNTDTLLGQTMIKVSMPCFTVRIESETASVSTINHFIKKINETSKQTTVAKNVGVTVVNDSNSSSGLLNHMHNLPPLPPLDGEALARHEFNSFFHPRRAEILMMLITVQFNKDLLLSKGLSTSLGILAHGPPGCGKSLLGFKIARALKRIPISVDLQRVSSLSRAYQLLYNPHLCSSYFNPSEVVILLDEFDEVVTHLNDKEKRFCMPPLHSWHGDRRDDSRGDRRDDSPISDAILSHDSRDMDKLKSSLSSYKSLSTTLQNELTVNSLLKLLQGPLPHDGSIKVATTNKLDVILGVREAIARAGRLTPLECTYPNKVVVDQMSAHYFGVPFDSDIPHLEGTPTSALTAVASSLMVQYKNDLVLGAQAFHEHILNIADRL